MEIETISREALAEKLERGDHFKLVMVLGESAWRTRHIPGSLHFADPESMLDELSPDDEIVVYCSGPSCMASAFAYWFLENRGYRNVRRYAGGIEEWLAAGLPLEGEQSAAEA